MPENRDRTLPFRTSTAAVILLLSMPAIVVASVVGVLFSLFQALTQIQEQTLSFAIKLIAVGVTLAPVAPGMVTPLRVQVYVRA